MLDASMPTTIKTYLTVAQVAERFNVSTDSIWRWKREGKFPAPYRVCSAPAILAEFDRNSCSSRD